MPKPQPASNSRSTLNRASKSLLSNPKATAVEIGEAEVTRLKVRIGEAIGDPVPLVVETSTGASVGIKAPEVAKVVKAGKATPFIKVVVITPSLRSNAVGLTGSLVAKLDGAKTRSRAPGRTLFLNNGTPTSSKLQQ